MAYTLSEIESHLTPLPEVAEPAPAPSVKRDVGTLEAKARAMLAAAKFPPASEGERNSQGYRHAAYLIKDFDLCESDTLDLLRQWNATNSPPMLAEELQQIVKDAMKYGKHEPGAKLRESRKPVKAVLAGQDGESDAACRPVYVWMKDVEAKPVRWLWQDRIPSAMLSLLIGIEGTGKTFCALDLAARITTGRPLPGSETEYDTPPIGNVVFLTSEDHLSFTIKPRLDAMKADPARIAALKGVVYKKGEEDFFDVMRHLPALETLIQEAAPVRVVIVDPLTAFLGATDQHRNGEVRMALLRFNSLAEKYGCAIIGISHLTKDTNRQALHRTLGSVAFTAAARSVWLVCEDKQDTTRRLFVPIKLNLARMPKSLAFRIRESAVVWEDGQFDYAADDVLAVESGEERTAAADAEQWLQELLADGRMRSSEILRLAAKEKFCEKTLKRAKSKLGICSEKEGIGGASVWFWTLPKP
jgi:hypothetical protein